MLSKTAVHALRAVVTLAELPPCTFAGAADVAGEIGAPKNYLGKLLNTLAAEGIVESQKGKGGGFRIATSPYKIRIYDVVEPIDHVSRWKGCFLGRARCSTADPCRVHDRWASVREQYLDFLRGTTIADLVEQPVRERAPA